MNYSEFIVAVNAGQIKQVTIDGERISGEKRNGTPFESIRPAVQDPELMPSLIKNNVVVEGTAPQRQGLLMQLLIASFPVPPPILRIKNMNNRIIRSTGKLAIKSCINKP